MGMAVGSKKLNANINVVPLVDITLVLLIIFMVMTPMMQRGYDMSIPEKAKSELTSTVAADQMVVQVKLDGILLNKKAIDESQLAKEIGELLVGRSQKIVFFEADDDVFYQRAVDIMDKIKEGGGVIGLVTTNLG